MLSQRDRKKLGERKFLKFSIQESVSHVKNRVSRDRFDFNIHRIFCKVNFIFSSYFTNLVSTKWHAPSFLPSILSMSRSSILDTIFRSPCCHYRVHPRCAREPRSSEGLYTRGKKKGRKEKKGGKKR